MNESLVFLIKLFHSTVDFDKEWDSYIAKDAIELLTDETHTQINIIRKDASLLTKEQEQILIEKLDVLIGNIKRFQSVYSNESDYHYYRRYEGPDWGLQAGIEDKDESTKYYDKVVKTHNEQRNSILLKLSSKINFLNTTISNLEDLYQFLSFEQIKISGITMGKDVTGPFTWDKYDTDLLELITALIESGSIQNQTKNLTRKEAIEAFSQFFNIKIKDAESKLTRATNRLKNVARYLTRLKDTLIDINWYNDKKIEPKSVFSENNSKLSSDKPFLTWDKSSADLLELITALFESKTIINSTNDLTIEKAIEGFSQFFKIEIKDLESEPSSATDKEIKISYLTFLISTFKDFAQDKEDRLYSRRR